MTTLCKKWRENKLINPATKYAIKLNGPTYNKLKKQCEDIIISSDNSSKKSSDKIIIDEIYSAKFKKNINKAICVEWKKNKNINPLTNRTIKEKNTIYNEFKKICSILKNTPKKSPEAPKKVKEVKAKKSPEAPKKVKEVKDDKKPEAPKKVKEVKAKKSPEAPKKVKEVKDDKKPEAPKKVKNDKAKKSPEVPKKVKEVKDDKKSEAPKKVKNDKAKKSPEKPKKVKDDKKSSKSDKSSFESYEFDNNLKRFRDYDIIINYLNKKIKLQKNECIRPYSEKNKYLLSDNLLLYKQIGSKSVFGIVFKCKNINPNYTDIPIFTAKLQIKTGDVKLELSILNFLSDYAVKNNIPHFPLVFKSLECGNIIRDDKYPELLAKSKPKNKNYSLILNELAAGDLKYFINHNNGNDLNEEIWKNTYEQIFMSIAILHSLGINHNDCHAGNFLYHKIKPGGCFHYKINGVDFYIKNLGYLWVIWDFGIVTKLYRHTDYISDYIRVNTVTRKNNLARDTEGYRKLYDIPSWGILDDTINIPKQIQELQYKISDNYLYENNLKELPLMALFNKKLTEDLWLKSLLDNNLLFSKKPFGEIKSSVNINFFPMLKSLLFDKDVPHIGTKYIIKVGK